MTRSTVAMALMADMARRQRTGIIWLSVGTVTLWGVILAVLLKLDMEPSSVLQGMRWVPPYFILFMGVAVAVMYTPVYVAHGITRRTIRNVATGFGLSAAIGMAVVVSVLFTAEAALYDVLGLTQFSTGIDRSVGVGAFAVLDLAVMYSVYFMFGWAIALAYYRLGPRWGTAVLVPSLLALTLADAWQWRAPFLYDVLPVLDQEWMGSLLMAGLCALGWWGGSRLSGPVPLRAK